MPPRAHRFLIPLAALLAALPLLITGPSCGHDFDFHLLSWLEAASQFAHLHYPHWAFTPAYNAGEPRFLFYPPLSWSLGALLGLILPWNLVPAAFTFTALTLSGFTAHRLAQRYASPNVAVFAAVLYLANPYMLFNAYERTAYGELLAAAWFPLLFLAALAPQTRPAPRIRIVQLAIPIALLWLTNAPAAIMGCYALAFVTLLRLILPLAAASFGDSAHSSPRKEDGRHPERSEGPLYLNFSTRPLLQSTRLHIALSTLAATLLGFALAAFYLLPAAFERRYIQSEMAVIEGMRIVDNTLFHRMTPPSPDNLAHDTVLHTASILAVELLTAIFIALAVIWVPPLARRRALPASLLPLPFLALLIAFLLTKLSLPLWNHAPELAFMQFPWRFTAILGAILSVLAAVALNRSEKLRILQPTRAALIAILLALCLSVPAWLIFHQPCDDEDSVAGRTALFHSPKGTEPTDEYTPATADNDALHDPDPPFWLVSPANVNPGDSVDNPAPPTADPGPTPTHLVLTVPAPTFLILNFRQFPDWQFSLNGHPVKPYEPVRNDGLVTLQLPPGQDTIDLAYHRPLDQSAGIALSLLAAVLTLALRKLPAGHRKAHAKQL